MIQCKRPGALAGDQAGDFVLGGTLPHNTGHATVQRHHHRPTIIVKRWSVNRRLEVSGVASEVRS